MSNVVQPVGVLTLQGSISAVVNVLDAAYTAASITLNFGKNQFKRLMIDMDWNAGGISTLALTGLAAASYSYSVINNTSTTPAGAVATAQNNWNIGTSAGATSSGGIQLILDLFAAPSRKIMTATNIDNFVGTGPAQRLYAGLSSDVTNDPTSLVITMDASRTGRIKAWGML